MLCSLGPTETKWLFIGIEIQGSSRVEEHLILSMFVFFDKHGVDFADLDGIFIL